MGSSSRLSRSIVRVALLAAVAGAWAHGARGAACPVPAPVLTGPSEIQAGESYALSWTSVFTDPTASNVNYYVVERSPDFAFSSSVDQITTQRSAITLPPAPASAKILYHRVVVKSTCPTASTVAITSNVVAIPVQTVCNAPPSVGELSVNPPNPPAYSIWVITWNMLGAGPGPGGGPTGLKFRIRQTSGAYANASEWVVAGGASSFTGAPGEYVYQVRAEASCGSIGPWSPSLRVTVGNVLRPALLLVSEPAPIAALVPAAGTRATTSFVVRNGGPGPILVRAKPDDSGFVVAPDSFTLAPNGVQTVGVTSLYVTPLLHPVHATVLLTAGDATLSVPLDCMITPAPSAAKVVWSDPAVDIGRDGDPVLRSIVNPADSVSAFVATVRAPWLSVASLDGQSWDRPLAAHELRTVRITVDRAKRRSGTGTEIGAIALATVGFPDSPESLLVTDDGPPVVPAATGPGATPATAARTRLLYVAFPNAIDARSVGRFAADLWLTNTDAVNPVAVSLLFNPVGAPGDGSYLRRFDLNLEAGETRRYRNVVGTLLGVDGAFTAEVRSPAPTVTATVLVNNRPLPATVAARNASRRTLAATTPATGQYGFELRPTIPGEGAKQNDPIHVVSGLAHDANRRTNLLLLETSGYDTTVLVSLYNNAGRLVTKNGQAVQLLKTVPANGTLQINDADELFDPEPLAGAYAYARTEWKSSATDATGAQHGSVVGMATVIDNRTQDSSLHVGVSTQALDPSYVPGSSLSGSRRALALLPFAGAPAPLFFPTVHSAGAPLANGEKPFWRTRVTLTNTSEEPRTATLEYRDASDSAVTGQLLVGLSPGGVFPVEDVLEGIGILPEQNSYGVIRISASKNNDGTWATGWAGVDVQTETYHGRPRAGRRRLQDRDGRLRVLPRVLVLPVEPRDDVLRRRREFVGVPHEPHSPRGRRRLLRRRHRGVPARVVRADRDRREAHPAPGLSLG